MILDCKVNANSYYVQIFSILFYFFKSIFTIKTEMSTPIPVFDKLTLHFTSFRPFLELHPLAWRVSLQVCQR